MQSQSPKKVPKGSIEAQASPLVIFMRAFPPGIVGVMVVQIALIIGVLMIGSVFLGLTLDKQFGTRPLLVLVLPIASSFLSVFLTYRLGMRTVAKSRQAYLNWKDTKEQEAERNSAREAQAATATPAADDPLGAKIRS